MSDSKRLELFSVCDQAESVGIGGHVRPDGDCVGSCLACYLFLKRKYPDKRIELFLEKPAEIFCCIAGFDEINSEFPEREPLMCFLWWTVRRTVSVKRSPIFARQNIR